MCTHQRALAHTFNVRKAKSRRKRTCWDVTCFLAPSRNKQKKRKQKKRAIILYINHLFIFLIPAGFIVSISADDLYYVMVSRIKGLLLHILLGVCKKGFSLLYDTSTKVKIPEIIFVFCLSLFIIKFSSVFLVP